MRDPADASSVREALRSDAPRIAALATQLGYSVTVEHVVRRLAARDAGREVLVAVVPRVGVVGWTSVSVRETLLGSRRSELEGLVVEDEYRSGGVGRALLLAAEAWARGKDCATLRLLTNIVRERAHAFYESLGFARHGYSFRLDLAPAPG